MQDSSYDDPALKPKNQIEICPDGTARVHLGYGHMAIIDAADVPLVAPMRWHSKKGGRTRYAAHTARDASGGKYTLAMHRLLLGLDRGDRHHVDHKNHNGLDNRRSNIRVASRSENGANRITRQRVAPYRGVTPVKGGSERKAWQARIKWEGRTLFLGAFPTPEDAARRYDAIAAELYGEFAVLNFDADGEANPDIVVPSPTLS